MAQCETSRAYQPAYPWVVNNDPAITGITFNTAGAHTTTEKCAGRCCWRSTSPTTWAGRGRHRRLEPGAHPVARPLPQGLHPARCALAGRVHARPRQRRNLQAVMTRTRRSASWNTPRAAAMCSPRTRTSRLSFWLRLVQVRAGRRREAAGQERLLEECRRQVAAARWHALEDRNPDRHRSHHRHGLAQLPSRPPSSGRSSASTPQVYPSGMRARPVQTPATSKSPATGRPRNPGARVPTCTACSTTGTRRTSSRSGRYH